MVKSLDFLAAALVFGSVACGGAVVSDERGVGGDSEAAADARVAREAGRPDAPPEVASGDAGAPEAAPEAAVETSPEAGEDASPDASPEAGVGCCFFPNGPIVPCDGTWLCGLNAAACTDTTACAVGSTCSEIDGGLGEGRVVACL